MKFQVIIKRVENGVYSAQCPSLKSCWSQGRTREEALSNIQEAIELYLEPSPEAFIKSETQEVVELSL